MMRWLNYIWVACCLLGAAGARGQDGVVVHSDPRLALLVRKSQPVVSHPVLHKSVSKHSEDNTLLAANTRIGASSAPAVKTTNVKANAVAAARLPVANATPKLRPVKINDDEASTTGRAGGWSPPVHHNVRVIYSGKGFRVQIYNGPDRDKAIGIKTEFMRNNPGVRTYLTYVSPCFRVKVGNYRTRNEALGMLKEANSVYTPCMIVPDIITISTF